MSDVYLSEDLHFTLDLKDETTKDGSLRYDYMIKSLNANISYPEWNNNTYSTVGFNLRFTETIYEVA